MCALSCVRSGVPHSALPQGWQLQLPHRRRKYAAAFPQRWLPGPSSGVLASPWHGCSPQSLPRVSSICMVEFVRCVCIAPVMPLWCHCDATMMPQWCHYDATVMPLSATLQGIKCTTASDTKRNVSRSLCCKEAPLRLKINYFVTDSNCLS